MADISRAFVYSQEVYEARQKGMPIVALESTIISHGMPYPQNVETARKVEAVVRSQGATPATIAILEGKVHIGLDANALELLGKAGSTCKKTSRRDIAYVIANKLNGATTVSGTAFLASKASIPVFVTGGIGGVHRGGELSMDVSADLTELSQTGVTVVCAGVKSILDIRRTLEVLETLGVPVFAYGTEEFPAFFTTKSGCRAPFRADSPAVIARAIQAQRSLGLPGGLLVGVPIPKDEQANGMLVEQAIESALREADEKGVQGAETTPFLLKRVNELSKGASLKSNIALILNNAKVGAAISVALSKSAFQPFRSLPGPLGHEAAVLCVGGLAQDRISRPLSSQSLVLHTSTPGTTKEGVGGVAHNVGRALSVLGTQVELVSSTVHEP